MSTNPSQKPKILLVDDIPENIYILMETLKDDYTIIAATSGEKALSLVGTNNPPDLILLDIMMPEMDGYEVCRRLQADEETRGIPVIFVTAKAEEEDELRGFDLGAVDYITKPISPPRVKARVRTQLLLKQARQTLEIQNDQLKEAARLREDVDNIMRHDLKSPLNSIVGTARILLQDHAVEKGDEESLETIESSGYRMLNMINLSLDLMKMERGTYPLQAVPLDIVGVLKRIVSEMQIVAQSKDVGLHLALEDRPLADDERFGAFAEELLCYSMLSNLIKNAVEASPEGGRVSIKLGGKDGGSIHIHNQGVVPEDIRSRFFDKYVTSGKSDGTGLGTYSARLIAETQGGSIRLETSEKEGTTIAVCLIPASVDQIDGTPSDSRKAVPDMDAQVARRLSILPPLHILLVDDDPDNRHIIKTYLNHSNLTVETADNGKAAVEKIVKGTEEEKTPYKAILMDIQMPVMDGFEATSRIREWESGPHSAIPNIPIIALSSHDDEATRKKCVSIGFDATLVKPVSKTVLLQSLLTLVAPTDDGGVPLTEVHSDTQDPDDDGKAADGKNNGHVVEIDADLEEILPTFLENKKADIETMDAAMAGPDFDTLQRLGHKLKGSFNMYGFGRMGELCSGIEEAAADGGIHTIRENLALLTDYMSNMIITYTE